MVELDILGKIHFQCAKCVKCKSLNTSEYCKALASKQEGAGIIILNICLLTWPGTQVGLVSNVPPEVCPEVRRLLVDLAAVGVVTQVHGRLPGGAAGVHTQRTPTLLTLAPTRSLQWIKFHTHHSSIKSSSRIDVNVFKQTWYFLSRSLTWLTLL